LIKRSSIGNKGAFVFSLDNKNEVDMPGGSVGYGCGFGYSNWTAIRSVGCGQAIFRVVVDFNICFDCQESYSLDKRIVVFA